MNVSRHPCYDVLTSLVVFVMKCVTQQLDGLDMDYVSPSNEEEDGEGGGQHAPWHLQHQIFSVGKNI